MTPLDIISIVLSFAAIVWFIWFVSRTKDERRVDDAHRAYFERHGHWPDEMPPTRPAPPAADR